MLKVASALEVQALELRSSSDSLLDDVQHVLSRGDRYQEKVHIRCSKKNPLFLTNFQLQDPCMTILLPAPSVC